MDDYFLVKKSGVRWYACVGDGGTGKTTLGKNICYFFDPTFDNSRIQTTARGIVQQLNKFQKIGSMKALLFDEPDESVHFASKEGKLLRSILGKARQQQIIRSFSCC